MKVFYKDVVVYPFSMMKDEEFGQKFGKVYAIFCEDIVGCDENEGDQKDLLLNSLAMGKKEYEVVNANFHNVVNDFVEVYRPLMGKMEMDYKATDWEGGW